MLLQKEYIGKEIRVEYRNGGIETDVLKEASNEMYPFRFRSTTYTSKGTVYWETPSHWDIMSVTLVTPEEEVYVVLLKKEYIGKRIRVEYRNGEIETEVLKEDPRNKIYPFRFRSTTYTPKGTVYSDLTNNYDIMSVTLVTPEEEEFNLSDFIGQVIKVRRRDGDIEEGVVSHDSSNDYPIKICGQVYTKGGSYFMDIEDDRDIVEILSAPHAVVQDQKENIRETKKQDIDLSLFVDKTVIVEFRDAMTPKVVKLGYSSGLNYKYLIGAESYTTEGRYYLGSESPLDIVRISEVMVNLPTPQPDRTRLAKIAHQHWAKQAKEFILNYNKDNVWKWLQQVNMNYEALDFVEKGPHMELAMAILNSLETERSE